MATGHVWREWVRGRAIRLSCSPKRLAGCHPLFGTRWGANVNPTWLVRGVYLALGAFSLAAIPGIYRLVVATLGERPALIAAWLMACEALMPRLSTRALIEVVAIPPLVWGVALAAEAVSRDSWRRAAVAGLLLGVAAMLRYQVGLVAACVVGCLLVARRPKLAAAMTGTGVRRPVCPGIHRSPIPWRVPRDPRRLACASTPSAHRASVPRPGSPTW